MRPLRETLLQSDVCPIGRETLDTQGYQGYRNRRKITRGCCMKGKMFEEEVKLVPGPRLQEKPTSKVAASLEVSSFPGHLL